MTTIVQLGEEDLALEFSRVLQSIGGTNGGKSEESKGPYEKLVVDGKYSELLDNGVFRQSDKILSSETETVDLVLCLCLAVLERITSPAQYASAVKSLIKLTEVSSATSNHSVIKIRFLVNLFNRLYARARQMEAAAAAARSTAPAVISETLALAYETLSAVFRSALVTNNAQCVVKQLKHLQSWLAGAGSIAATPSSELWILAHQIAKASVNATTTPIAALHSNLLNESDVYLLQYLKSLQNTSADKLNAALPHAQAAALRAIHSPLLPLAAGSATQATASPLEASRLLSLNAVKHLSNGSEQNKLVYKLLSIFASPNGLTEYDGLYKSHGSIIKELSLDHDANLKKLRIIALCRLALQHDKLTYADIAAVLKVDVSRSDLIESAVIEAIQSGRLDAKLDQESDCVLVKRVTGVHFWLANDGEWTALSNKLGAWKNNVVQVVNTLALNPHQASFQEDAAEDI